jgi:hypothetical protein
MAMISTSKLISSIEDVPREWVFEYYLNLKEKLTGQDVKLLSVFNANDKVPSMFVYFDTFSDKYKFKDFSSGYQGNHIDLIKYLYSVDTNTAMAMIILAYEQYIQDNGKREDLTLKVYDKYKVTDFEIRHWTNLDEAYWSRYKIGSKLLEHYNVAPLEFFKMEKEQDGQVLSHTFNRKYVYGYFRKDGSLYKIYMPKVTDKKFIKVQNYIQGSDQLLLQTNKLLITSSLKDLMCFVKLGFSNIDVIAPDSENSMLTELQVNRLKQKYKTICVLFDNDAPGIASMEKYRERYGFESILLPMEKDLSDSVAMHGLIKVKEALEPLIANCFKL